MPGIAVSIDSPETREGAIGRNSGSLRQSSTVTGDPHRLRLAFRR